MEEVKRNDLIFFRNEVLGDIKQLELQLNEKISKLSKEFQNSNLINENKFSVYQQKIDEISLKSDTSDFQMNIKDKIDKNIKKIDDVIINNNVKIQKLEKDLANSCYKYDNIYLKNMSSPGLIGDGCPYPTMKSFFIFLEKKMKELVATKDKTLSEFQTLKIYLDKGIEKIEKRIVKNEEEIDKNIIERLNEYNKYVNEKTKKLEDRFEYIRTENSKHIFNVIKNQEIINEKLKLELKKYSLINETLITFYKKQNDIAISNENENKYKNLLNSKSKNKMPKKVALNINELLPALQKIEDSYNLNTNLFKKNDIKELTIEDNHFEIKKPRKKDISMTTIKKDNSNLFLRRSSIFTYNNKKLLKPYSNLYKEDNLLTIKNSNNINNINNMNKTIGHHKFQTEEKASQKNAQKRPYIINLKNTQSEKNFDKLKDSTNLITSIERKESINKKIQKEKKKKEIRDNFIMTFNQVKDNISEIEDEKDQKEKVIKDKEKKREIIKGEIIPVLNLNNNKNLHLNSNKMNIINQEKYIDNKTAKKKENINVPLKKIEKNIEKENENQKENNEKLKKNININNINNTINTNNTTNTINTNNTINNSLKDDYKFIEMKIDEKLNKYISKNNEYINGKFELIKKYILFLFKELNKLIKEREKHKNRTNLILKPNNSLGGNINLRNIKIYSDTIIPITKKSYERSVKNTDKSNNKSSNENETIKKLINNRVIRSQNRYDIHKNDSNDMMDNYCFLLNKIEPFLIKKFSD